MKIKFNLVSPLGVTLSEGNEQDVSFFDALSLAHSYMGGQLGIMLSEREDLGWEVSSYHNSVVVVCDNKEQYEASRAALIQMFLR